MAMPASEMADEAVLAYKVCRWDYQLLRTHGISWVDHDLARDSYHKLSKLTKADTKEAAQATYVSQKRQLIGKLHELRAAAGQAMKNDLRLASAAVGAAKDAAEKARLAMVQEQKRTSKRMLKLLGDQGEHLEDLDEVGKVLGAAEDGADRPSRR